MDSLLRSSCLGLHKPLVFWIIYDIILDRVSNVNFGEKFDILFDILTDADIIANSSQRTCPRALAVAQSLFCAFDH